jgi:hypothetical protein
MFEDELRSGYGEFQAKNERFSGQFENNFFSGFGKSVFGEAPYQGVYIGNFARDVMHGSSYFESVATRAAAEYRHGVQMSLVKGVALSIDAQSQ